MAGPPAARESQAGATPARPCEQSGGAAAIAALERELAATREALRATTEALRAAEAAAGRIAAIYDTMPGYIMERDAAGRILGLNGLAAVTMGTTVAEATGRPLAAFGSPETVAEVLASDAEVLREGRPVFGISQRYQNPDGSEEWLWVNKAPLEDPATGQRSVLAISHVITELKAAEAERDELRFRRIEARIAEELGGFRFRLVADVDLPLPDDWFEGLAPSQIGLVREVIAQAIEHGTDTGFRLLRAGPGGTWRAAPARCVAGSFPSGRRFAVLGVGRPEPAPPEDAGGTG